ncbi:Insulin-like growth factor binding protein, N-terminal [Pseudocohnilembus persalinus]|uniref:Insulin-like growth factor binding protein, N-terminal n=1 Tax=Pseudocohnilembus persalinus TaxID=266149 RepID=A0A0V0R8N3_PSEPJ|nr:Insulin-like growth factor binding protein, N-terminal [Pseudocohnilembus persalinus]|eukprot:KRX10830.1 Insulin-like growth factor binding protein, N-terminal [Pseudocohnilembus persalinus]
MLTFQDKTGILFALDSSNQFRIQYYFDKSGELLGNKVFNKGFLIDTQNVQIDYVFLKMEEQSDIYTILVGNENQTVAQDKYFYMYTYGHNGTLICSQKFESFDNIRFNYIMFGYVTEQIIWVKGEDQESYSLFFYMNPRNCSYFIKSGESNVSVISAKGNIFTVDAKFYSLVNKEGKFSIAALGNTFTTAIQYQYSDFKCQKAQLCLNECQSCTTINKCDICVISDPIRETNQCYCPENYYNVKGYEQCCPEICVDCQKYYSCDYCSQSKIQKEDYVYLKHCSCPLNYFGCLEQNQLYPSICNKYENKVALLDICISQIVIQ